MGPNKYVHMLFAIGALVAAFLLAKTGEWVWGIFAKPNDLAINGGAFVIGILAAFLAYRNEKIFTAAYDVVAELEKVTWPERKETRSATLVVIVTVAISSVILWGFDMVWGSLANMVMR